MRRDIGRVLVVLFPFIRIGGDIMTNAVKGCFIADNMVVIITLPDFAVKSRPAV